MKECNNLCDLKSCFLCKLCLPEWLPAVGVHKKNFEVKKGHQIFKEDDPVIGIYFVYKGTIKVHKKWDNEKELIIRFARPGDVIGYLGLGKMPVYPVTTTALEPSVVCFLDINFFMNRNRILFIRRNAPTLSKLIFYCHFCGLVTPRNLLGYVKEKRFDLAAQLFKAIWWNVTHSKYSKELGYPISNI